MAKEKAGSHAMSPGVKVVLLPAAVYGSVYFLKPGERRVRTIDSAQSLALMPLYIGAITVATSKEILQQRDNHLKDSEESSGAAVRITVLEDAFVIRSTNLCVSTT